MVMNMARIAQDGTPRGLYEQPNSHFVADFIGDANTVPVTIESHQGDMASARLGPLLLTLPHHGEVEGMAELSIRPHALQLSRGTGGLHGHVAKAAYLGSHMEYWMSKLRSAWAILSQSHSLIPASLSFRNNNDIGPTILAPAGPSEAPRHPYQQVHS
jgi:iron(III) transport system ATP-binding protein